MFVIAGVTGHVGSEIAKALLAKKQKVKVIVRDAQKGATWSKQGAELAVGSLDDQNFLASALKGAKGFFVLLPPNFAAPDFYGWQRQTGQGIAAAVKAAGVPHVVMLSSVGADVAEGNGPIKGLHHLENALRSSGAKLTAIRAGSFQENVGMSLGAARGQGIYPNFMGSSDYPMPMIATRDIATLATERLLEGGTKHETIDLHGPAYSVKQVVEKLGRALGKELKIVDVPQANWVGAMTQAGMPKHVAEIFAEMYGGFAAGKLTPKGDRAVQGKTELDDTIKRLVA